MKGKVVAICIWGVVLLGIGSIFYRTMWVPHQEKAKQEAIQKQEKEKIAATSAPSQYRHNIRFGIDSFSGYAVLRSQEFQNFLRTENIKVDFVDDGADYTARINALKSGDTQMAAFTIDALISVSAKTKEIPAVIVAIIDETRGADAMISYKQSFPNVDALNVPETKFILTPNSPSETLVRVMMASFNLNRLGRDAIVKVGGAEEVFKYYRKSKDTDPNVYVVWQPFGTKILDNPNTHVLIDSGRFKGYIVDVIVCSRDFLYKNPDAVKGFVCAYFRAVYQHRDKMLDLVMDDARRQGQPLSQKQAEDLVKGVWWKNTQENYAHFGIGGLKTLQHVEDMILNLTKVLLKTDGIDKDPTNGHPEELYYNKLMEDMSTSNFHPGFEPETIRAEKTTLTALTAEQWKQLVPVGTLEIPELVFARGSSRLSDASIQNLNILYETLKTFPSYYVLVCGNASTNGDLEANKELALDRAKTAGDYLISLGANSNRIRVIAGEPTGETSVKFVLGELPY
jgi:ABC-type nitrate/sulfonate/bicarbonate transport system substrate-binding protein